MIWTIAFDTTGAIAIRARLYAILYAPGRVILYRSLQHAPI
jgi:hypothetical protein